MTFGNIKGNSVSSVLNPYNPCFIWDPYSPEYALGDGYQGGGRVDFTVNDIDSISTSEEFSVWDAGNERFQITTPSTKDNVLGSVGDFSDGTTESFWSSPWSTTTLGFAVVSPTSSGMLVQDSVPADIIVGGTMPNRTYVDTTEVDDTVIERSNARSATYRRCFQILVKSNDGLEPLTGNVLVGINASSGTRSTSASTWYRKLPGSRGWWAVMLTIEAGTGTQYLSLKFKAGTGRWYIAAPMFYNAYSTFENIVHGPIPCYTGPTSYARGQWNCYTKTSEFAISPAGWLAMSMVLPDRSISNGHLTYAGDAEYGFSGMFSWISSTYRIRMIMSDSLNHPVIQLDDGGVSFAYLDFGENWQDFEKIGLVVTWGTSNGSNYASLYINGKKIDSVVDAINWFPQNLAASTIYIGSDGLDGAAADCWIPRLAIGRRPMHRSTARVLSLKMRDFARTGVLGDLS
jgi:hypothetical protein